MRCPVIFFADQSTDPTKSGNEIGAPMTYGNLDRPAPGLGSDVTMWAHRRGIFGTLLLVIFAVQMGVVIDAAIPRFP